MTASLIQFKEIVDEEIIAYEAMEELYKIKQSFLVQGRSDALWEVDAKIVSRMENIKSLNLKRKEVAKYLGNEDLTMTEAIEKAKASNDVLANKLQVQKTKLNILSKSIQLCESTNMELIKHGLIIVGKTLNIIMNAVLPQTSEYNKFGKNIDNNKVEISSIVEEA